jgi:hypothetical protein
MRLPWSTKYLLLPGFLVGASVAVIVFADQFFEVHYTFVGIGAVLVGVTGFGSLWQKVEEAHRIAVKTEKNINGGMANLASQILQDEIRVAGLEAGLGARVIALEESKRDCDEEKRLCLEENEKLRDWVITRLDGSGNGRSDNR